jgi:hypothetical protein
MYFRKEININTYLFKGMCSNGPLVGIVPHKSLFETSLKREVKLRLSISVLLPKIVKKTAFTKNINITYTTLRLEIPASPLGIGPFNLLSLSRLPNHVFMRKTIRWMFPCYRNIVKTSEKRITTRSSNNMTTIFSIPNYINSVKIAVNPNIDVQMFNWHLNLGSWLIQLSATFIIFRYLRENEGKKKKINQLFNLRRQVKESKAQSRV